MINEQRSRDRFHTSTANFLGVKVKKTVQLSKRNDYIGMEAADKSIDCKEGNTKYEMIKSYSLFTNRRYPARMFVRNRFRTDREIEEAVLKGISS